ncbi:iron-sulfur cluster repair di-iron protein [Flavobacterium orientale]|uniref:Iron-sulfur cluster repair di-iron protein n=1 Tax=Flavobacterium orientale TaxID=1756020 RepID=A0A916Y8E7_9FLAO|nr:iron-sulfur cluster repair di-iron protein [Flavobacterium orientale]
MITMTPETTIGEMVAQDYRAASVFGKHGIDFCCKGHRTLQEACERKGFSQEQIQSELKNVLQEPPANAIDFKTWPLDLLTTYIEKTHHRYVEKQIPVLLQFLEKLCKVHGGRHPELHDIYDLFRFSAGDLTQHMKKEELILFPFIQKMVKAQNENQRIEQPPFGSVENPIAMMKDEHTTEGDRFATIATLTDGFAPPEDACTTYRVTYQLLEEFEQDLHKHIHLENNILFPKAIALQLELQ